MAWSSLDLVAGIRPDPRRRRVDEEERQRKDTQRKAQQMYSCSGLHEPCFADGNRHEQYDHNKEGNADPFRQDSQQWPKSQGHHGDSVMAFHSTIIVS